MCTTVYCIRPLVIEGCINKLKSVLNGELYYEPHVYHGTTSNKEVAW